MIDPEQMSLEIKALREQTGESIQHCKEVIRKKYAEKEKKNILELLYNAQVGKDLEKILEYLIQRS